MLETIWNITVNSNPATLSGLVFPQPLDIWLDHQRALIYWDLLDLAMLDYYTGQYYHIRHHYTNSLHR